jgi:hypothetical protein
MKITGILFTLLGLSLCMTLHTGCTGKTSSEETSSTKPRTLASATELINDRCPEWVDSESRLDSVLLSKEGEVYYYYTLPNKESRGINPSSFTAFLLSEIIENIRSNPDLRMHRDSSLTFIFNYTGRGGDLITEFKVGPERYK